MTEDQLIEDTFIREGVEYTDQSTVPPIDQPTGAGGITLATLSEFLGYQATVDELKALTRITAAPVVRWKLRQLAKDYEIDEIAFMPLRIQMIDFAYNSGPALAFRWLQRVLRIPRTGRMDSATKMAVNLRDGFLVNEALVAARLRMIDMSTDGTSIDKRFEEGLENRAHKFSLLEVP
jgi:lysozyme family protein